MSVPKPGSGYRVPNPATAAVVVALASALLVAFLPGVVALVAPTLLGALVLVTMVHAMSPDAETERRLLRWTTVAFVAHLVFGLILTNAGGPIHQYLAAGDANTYDDLARRILAHWTTGGPGPTLPPGKEGFYYLLAGTYWVLGAHTAAGLAVNATLSAAVVPLLSDTTRRLFGKPAARYVPPLVVLLPGLLLWTSQLLKEAVIVLLVVAAANCAIRMTDRVSPGAIAGLAMSLALLFTFRAWVALIMAAGLMVGIALSKDGLMSGLGTGLSGATLVAVLLAFGLGYSGYRAAVNTNFEDANTVRQDLASRANTGFDVQADISTPQTALSYLPRGLLSFSLGPFPWQIRGTRQVAVVPDMLVWWWLLPSLVVGAGTARRLAGRRILVLVLPATVTTMLLSLSVGNFGTVVREREQIVVLIMPLFALGMAERAARNSAKFGASPSQATPISPGLS